MPDFRFQMDEHFASFCSKAQISGGRSRRQADVLEEELLVQKYGSSSQLSNLERGHSDGNDAHLGLSSDDWTLLSSPVATPVKPTDAAKQAEDGVFGVGRVSSGLADRLYTGERIIEFPKEYHGEAPRRKKKTLPVPPASSPQNSSPHTIPSSPVIEYRTLAKPSSEVDWEAGSTKRGNEHRWGSGWLVKSRKRATIDKSMIGTPTNFRHVAHMGKSICFNLCVSHSSRTADGGYPLT